MRTMTLRVQDLADAKGITAYRLAADSDRRISQSAAYRLLDGSKSTVSALEVSALCEVLEVEPNDLFVWDAGKPRKKS